MNSVALCVVALELCSPFQVLQCSMDRRTRYIRAGPGSTKSSLNLPLLAPARDQRMLCRNSLEPLRTMSHSSWCVSHSKDAIADKSADLRTMTVLQSFPTTFATYGTSSDKRYTTTPSGLTGLRLPRKARRIRRLHGVSMSPNSHSCQLGDFMLAC